MNKMVNVLLIFIISTILLFTAVQAQEMVIHSGNSAIRVNLASIDSLTFSPGITDPPASIMIQYNPEGYDAGGNIWGIEVAALLQNTEGQPVNDGFFVDFALDRPELYINDALTGNENLAGETCAGIANSQLLYHSLFTNEQVWIYVSIPQFQLSDSLAIILPAQEAGGTLYSDLPNWNYTIRNEDPAVMEDVAEFDISVYLYDGHNYPVNNQLVRFMTNKGRYYSFRDPITENRWNPQYEEENEFTGQGEIIDQDGNPIPSDGWADPWLVVTREEAFPEIIPEPIGAYVSALIIGYPDLIVEPLFLNLYQ